MIVFTLRSLKYKNRFVLKRARIFLLLPHHLAEREVHGLDQPPPIPLGVGDKVSGKVGIACDVCDVQRQPPFRLSPWAQLRKVVPMKLHSQPSRVGNLL